MASTVTTYRQAISRLKVGELRQMCRDIGLKPNKLRKDELVECLVDKNNQDSENQAPGTSGSVEEENINFEGVGYVRDPSTGNIPPVKFASVFDHIVEKSNRNSKCLQRGIKHFDEGDIQDLCYKEISDNRTWFRAKCVASQKQKKYTVYAAMNRFTGDCLAGRCDCPQGLPGNCSHVSGLLLALEFIHRTREQNPGNLSSTSRLCQWKKPRNVKVNPKPLTEIQIFKSSYGKTPKSSTGKEFDPRCKSDQVADTEGIRTQVAELAEVYPNTGLLHLWNISVQTPTVEDEVIIEETELDTMTQSLIIKPTKSSDIPTEEDISEFVAAQNISKVLSDHIEECTRGQRDNPLWLALHAGRLTSSSFGEILSSISTNENKSLIKRIMGYTTINRLPWTMRWGQDHETDAITAYKGHMAQKGTPVEVTLAGLTLSPTCSYLGASSDGHVFDASQPEGLQKGVVEVKCPCSVDGQDIRGLKFMDIVECHKSFFLKKTDHGYLELKKSSHHFTQVQGEMAIMSVLWTDFVVWNQKDLVVERIYFDVDFWENNLFPKLEVFYRKKVTPEILTGKLLG